MRIVGIIAGILLGLLFLFASISYFLHLGTPPAPPAGSAADHFMQAMLPTGYFAFVKTVELLGGAFVLLPATRRLGLLLLGPVIVNIDAFTIFVMHGQGPGVPPAIIISVLALVLLVVERRAFAAFIRGS
jgi:putative oxidoreductase